MDTRITDPTTRYADIVLAFLREYAEEMYGQDPSPLEVQVIADRAGHHYQLLRVGWANGRFVFSIRFHFDVKEGKWTAEMVRNAQKISWPSSLGLSPHLCVKKPSPGSPGSAFFP